MNSQSSMAGSKGSAADPVTRSRHTGSAIVLLVLAAPLTLSLLFWTTAPLPVIGGIAVLWAAGLGLLTRSTVGLWLGRLAATGLLLSGVYTAWLFTSIFFTLDGGMWREVNLLFTGAVAVLLVGAGMGILVALRPRAPRDR